MLFFEQFFLKRWLLFLIYNIKIVLLSLTINTSEILKQSRINMFYNLTWHCSEWWSPQCTESSHLPALWQGEDLSHNSPEIKQKENHFFGVWIQVLQVTHKIGYACQTLQSFAWPYWIVSCKILIMNLTLNLTNNLELFQSLNFNWSLEEKKN